MTPKMVREHVAVQGTRTGTKQHILITGGLGFIGTHIADAYLAAGQKVTLLDSMVSAVNDGSWYEGNPDAEVLKISVEDYFANGGTVRPFDRVIHAASHVGPAGILKYAGKIGYDIARGAYDVIQDCLRWDKPIVAFSSAEVYGRSGRLAEDDTIMVPVDYSVRIEYAIAKTLTEAMIVNSARRGLRGFVIRPFNVAGARQSKAGGFVMPTFVQQALAGEPITVFATGEQTRAFLSAVDLARFLVDHWDAAMGSGRHIFNLGNPDNVTTVSGLADRVKATLKSPSQIVYMDGKLIHGDLYEEAVSIHKQPVLRSALEAGWRPHVTLDDLIRQTIEFYQSHKDYRANAVKPAA